MKHEDLIKECGTLRSILELDAAIEQFEYISGQMFLSFGERDLSRNRDFLNTIGENLLLIAEKNPEAFNIFVTTIRGNLNKAIDNIEIIHK